MTHQLTNNNLFSWVAKYFCTSTLQCAPENGAPQVKNTRFTWFITHQKKTNWFKVAPILTATWASTYMFYCIVWVCTQKQKKKPSCASAARLHDSTGRGSGPRRCLETDVHSPTTMEPARSLQGAGGGVCGRGIWGEGKGRGLGSYYCDRVLLTAKTASSHFQRALVKKFLRRWDGGRHLPIAAPANGAQHLENTAAEGRRKEEGGMEYMHTCCGEQDKQDNSCTLFLLFI